MKRLKFVLAVFGLIFIGVSILALIIIFPLNFKQDRNTGNNPEKSKNGDFTLFPTSDKTGLVDFDKMKPAPKNKYFYPISDFDSRLTVRTFGQKVVPADAKKLVCGAEFSGYHDADDLETTAAEKNIDVPVYAIADGTVKLVNHVNGYGGLIVIEHNLNSQVVTANYGHINLASTSLKVGDMVKAGDKIANLGQGCSSQTDGERKHSHFALHEGSSIDVAGYVKTQAELNDWLNPEEILKGIGAVEK